MAEPLQPADRLHELADKILQASQEWFPDIYTRDTLACLIHATLGVTGEAGELANYIKKINRKGELDEHLLGAAIFEAADTIIYCLLFLAMLDVDPYDVIAEKHGMNELRFGLSKSSGS